MGKTFEEKQTNTSSVYSYNMHQACFCPQPCFKEPQIRICTTLVSGPAILTFQTLEIISRTTMFNPFQSNYFTNRILPSSYLFLGDKEVGGLLVIILKF
jgi:hypothetical protein